MRYEETGRGRFDWTTVALGAAAGVSAFYAVRSLAERNRRTESRGLDPYATESITINKPIEQVYDAWRNLESVGFLRDAQIVEAREQEMCVWTSSRGPRGEVHFRRAPGARGTEVRVQLDQPQRHFGQSVVRALGMAPDQLIREDLRRFKQLLETGEITRSDGPALWRPAQPASSRDEAEAYAGGWR